MRHWKGTLKLGDIFHNEEIPREQRLIDIASRFHDFVAKRCDDFDALDLSEELTAAAKDADVDWFDSVWNEVYNWADANSLWIDTVSIPEAATAL